MSRFNHADKGRSSTIVIAASDTPTKLKAQADYICDGTNDQEEIRAAINGILNLSNAWPHYTSDTTVVIGGINFPLVWFDGTTYHAYGGDATYANILHATSADGLSWALDTENNPMITKGEAYDSSSVAVANVWNEGANWYMVYRGSGACVCLATASAASGPWTKYASNPVINDAIGIDPAGIMKVSSTYYLYTNTTGGDREVNYYTSTDLHTWVRGVGNPIFTGGRYCSCPFVYNSIYYLLVSRYINNGRGGVIELWSCTSPTFKDGQRKFLGVVIYDATHPSVDTPTVVTADITRVFANGTDVFNCYYAKQITTSGIKFPGFLVQPGTVAQAIANVVMPKTGSVYLLEGTYNIGLANTRYYLDIPYGIKLEGNRAEIKLANGTTLDTNFGLMVIDYGSVVKDLKINGNRSGVTSGTHYGAVISGGLLENCEVLGFNGVGVFARGGVMRGGKAYNNKVGIRAYKYARLVDVDICGNGDTIADRAIEMYDYGVLNGCTVHSNVGRGVYVAGINAKIDTCKIYENGHYGVEIPSSKSVTILGTHLNDNAGYSSRGQISNTGKLNMVGCFLTDYILANNTQVYLAADSDAVIGNCLIKGGAGGISDNSVDGLTSYDITAPLQG